MQVRRTVNQNRPNRSGFTLVEVLMVVAIIGILVGLTVPAVAIAMRSIKQRAIAMECTTIADAVNKYNAKYGDYPPDGSDRNLLLRHIKKVFPQIASSEINLLTGVMAVPSGNPIVAGVASGGVPGALMDPPEALVFFLGGFSSDPVHPFTGTGGPLHVVVSGGTISSVQYNVDRTNAFMDFKQTQLTLSTNGSGLTVSSDDALAGGAVDLLPAYVAPSSTMPYVYFDARTYRVPPDTAHGRSSSEFNRYIPSGHGLVAPYRSTEENTKVVLSGTPSVDERNLRQRWMNEKGFQVISAGLDDHFGGSAGLFYMFKPQGGTGATTSASGDSFNVANGVVGANKGFRDTDSGSYQLDNVTNFSEGILGDSLDN
jgi:prepilin-type N-terminal cleavage/methylation domain-containing protein